MNRRGIRGGSLAAVAAVLAGCVLARIELPDGQRVSVKSESFRQYAGAVFRRQNEALDGLIAAQQAASQHDAARYYELEDMIVDNCIVLNRYATLRRDGAAAPMSLQRKLPAAIVGCDRTVTRVEQYLASGE